ncbi:MAG: hypothetical protein JOZ81_26330, partial [Chloroflexi bacterium]|nr:hypothetical protein [Chloroflexota bacterium]
MTWVLRLCALFALLGLVAGLVVFILVRLGIIVATGAQPFGVLAGLGVFGAILAFLLHAVFGMIAGFSQLVVPITSLMFVVFGAIGAIRRQRPWYTPLAGVALFAAFTLLQSGAERAMDWLGSASDWDAASEWSATAGTFITGLGLLPLYGIWTWRWCGRTTLAREGLEERFWKAARNVALGTQEMISTAGAILTLAGGVGLIAFAWSRGGIAGVLIALLAGGVLYGLVAVAGAIVGTVANVLIIASIGLPMAAALVQFPDRREVIGPDIGESHAVNRTGSSLQQHVEGIASLLSHGLELVEQEAAD